MAGPRLAPPPPPRSIRRRHHDRDVEDAFKLHTLGRTRVLRETSPLEEVNEAFDDIPRARNKEPRVVLTV